MEIIMTTEQLRKLVHAFRRGDDHPPFITIDPKVNYFVDLVVGKEDFQYVEGLYKAEIIAEIEEREFYKENK